MNFHEGEIMKMQQQRVPSEINPVVKMEILMPAEPPKSTKERYRKMKRKFKLLVYENECYQEELRNLQRKLLKLSRDKKFVEIGVELYEKVEDSSDDSDVEVDETTDVSDSEELPQSQQTSKKSHAAKTTKKQRLNSEASSESGQNQSTPKPPRDTKRKPKKTKAELAAEQALASSPMKVVQVSVERLTSTRSQDASVSGFTGISLPLNRSPQKSSSTQPSDGVERWKVPVGLPESSQSVAVLSGLEPESPCIGGPPMNSQNNGGGD